MMSTEYHSGAEVWMHKQTGDLCITMEVYVMRQQSFETAPHSISNISLYESIGIGFQTKQGITFILDHSARDYFEVIGEF